MTLRRGLVSALVLLAAAIAQLGFAPGASAEGWTSLNAGTSVNLYDVDCPTTSTCFAVGVDGKIIKTTNSGGSWSSQNSGVPSLLLTIECPSVSLCYVGGQHNTLLKTTDGGANWATQSYTPSSFTPTHQSLSCPSTTMCVSSGSSGAIARTTNGGSTWTNPSSGTSLWLMAISCPSTSVCYIAGELGVMLKSTDGGATWSSTSSVIPGHLGGIWCTDTATCYAVGDNGAMVKTTNGGSSWTSMPSGTSRSLYEITCSTSSKCYVGESTQPANGEILMSADAGASWISQPIPSSSAVDGIACPSSTVCYAVGHNGLALALDATPPAAPTITSKPGHPSSSSNASFSFAGAEPGGSFECKLDTQPSFTSCSSPKSYSNLSNRSHTFQVRQIDAANNVGSAASYTWTVDVGASDACESATATAIDGYAASGYLRLKLVREPGRTVVCFRAQEGPIPFMGGNVTISDPAADPAPPQTDANIDACKSQPPEPLLEGTVAGVVPLFVDSYSQAGEAWVCLQAGSQKVRVIVPAQGSTVPTVTPMIESPRLAPGPETGTAGYPSSTCQAQGGESGRIVNANVAGGCLALYSAQPSAGRTQLCVRIDGPAGLGGMLDVDTTANPGGNPVQESDEPCPAGGTPIAEFTQPQHLKIKVFTTGNTAAICVEALRDSDQTRIRKLIEVAPGTGIVTPQAHFLPDPGTPVPGV